MTARVEQLRTRRIGGGHLCDTTFRPVILVDQPRDAKVSTHEVFGPVTCVYGVDEIDDAIAAANSLPVAFQACSFTNDLHTAFKTAEHLDAPAVMVNDHSAFRTHPSRRRHDPDRTMTD